MYTVKQRNRAIFSHEHLCKFFNIFSRERDVFHVLSDAVMTEEYSVMPTEITFL